MNYLVVNIFFILQYLTISVNSCAFKCGDVYQLSVSYNENNCGVDDEGAEKYCDDFGKFIDTMKLNNTMKNILCEYGKQPIIVIPIFAETIVGIATNDKIKMVDKYSSCRAHRWNGCVIFEFNDESLYTKNDYEGRRYVILV